jgi:predicted amidohydrolase
MMRIAIFQGPAEPGEVSANLDLLDRQAAAATRVGARLLICPEMFLTGYNIGGVRARELAEPADGPSMRRAAEFARQSGIALLYGYPERAPGGGVYNAALLIDRDGRVLANARKCHLYGEIDHGMFTPGPGGFATADLDGLRIGILICYDVEFPESVRTLALAGVELVAVPTALMQPFEIVTRAVVPARAYENQVFLAYANRTGSEGEQTYVGESRVVAPDGADLAVAGRGEELIVAPIEIERLRASRAINTHLENRRVELYRSILEPPAQHEREGGQR